MQNDETSDEVSVDCQDVLAHDPVLYRMLVDYPGEVIPVFDTEANIIAASLSGLDIEDIALKVGAAAP